VQEPYIGAVQIELVILVKLIIAHLLGDFFLQPYKWVKDKQTRKIRSPWLLAHVGTHAVLMSVLLWDLDQMPMILAIMIIHYGVDLLKVYAQRPTKQTFWFFLDQALHFITLFVCWYLFTEADMPELVDLGTAELIFLTGAIFLTAPVGLSLKVFLSRWSLELEDNNSLEKAGSYIGILERLLVYVFVLSGHWEAIGFLIAAKSVFRFSDLKDAQNRRLTEYILIGTLLSFGLAILTGMFVTILSKGL